MVVITFNQFFRRLALISLIVATWEIAAVLQSNPIMLHAFPPARPVADDRPCSRRETPSHRHFHQVSLAGRSDLAIFDTVERETSGQLRALAIDLLQDYCEALMVLDAMGSPTDPPQPHGHDLMPTEDATLELFNRVRARGPIWRSCSA